MSILLSLDGGLRGCGVGLFEGLELARGAYIKNPEQQARGMRAWFAMARAVSDWVGVVPVDVVAAEEMQVDARTAGKTDDVLQVNAVVAAVTMAVHPQMAFGYRPSQWKGSVPGDTMVERIESRLTPAERLRLERCAGSLKHNMIDGIGVGLHHMGRLTPRRVIAR